MTAPPVMSAEELHAIKNALLDENCGGPGPTWRGRNLVMRDPLLPAR